MERYSQRVSGESALRKLLDGRYGDGSVYLRAGSSMVLFGKAQAMGLLSSDNFITRKGRQFLAGEKHCYT